MPELKAAKSPPWLKRLGNRIRQTRRVRGLTQTDVAGPNLTKSFISLLESGRTYPSVGTLVALADRLQTSLALLLLDHAQLPRETALNLFSLARSMAVSPSAHMDRLLATAEALAADEGDMRAELMLTRGDIASVQGKLKDAERWFEGALTWSRKRRLRAYEPRALARLAGMAFHRGDDAKARQRLDEALTQFRSTRTLRSVEGCDAMLAYAEALSRQGKSPRALRVLEEVAQVATRQDLPLTLGKANVAMGRVLLASGRPERSVEALRNAKSPLEAAGDSLEAAQAYRVLGRLLLEAGSLQEAHTALQHALRIQERLGEVRRRALTLDDLARVLLRLEKTGEAQASVREALNIVEAHHDDPQRGRILITMAQIAKAQRRWKPAADNFREAIEIFRKAKLTAELGEAARELGMLLKERGEHAEAAEFLAMAISTERGTRPSE